MTASDRDLLIRWKGGDVEAFLELARRSEPRVLAFLGAWTWDPGEREDLYQETLLRVFAGARRLDPDAPFAFHTLAVARNLAVDRHRRRAVERREAPRLAAREIATEGPEENAVLKERRLELLAALDRLEPPQREALALKLWGGLSWREVGRVLDCSEDSAARRGAGALARLATDLKDWRPA